MVKKKLKESVIKSEANPLQEEREIYHEKGIFYFTMIKERDRQLKGYNCRMERVVKLTIFIISLFYVTACPPCEKLHCPKSIAECSLGVVPDPCDCCHIGRCGLTSGQLCYNQTLSPPDHKKYGLCAQALYCSVTPSEDNQSVSTVNYFR